MGKIQKGEIYDIQFYRGSKEKLPSYLSKAKPAFTTDTYEMFIGTGDSVAKVGPLQVNKLPEASKTYKGVIVQFVGPEEMFDWQNQLGLHHNFFYECKEVTVPNYMGEMVTKYEWVRTTLGDGAFNDNYKNFNEIHTSYLDDKVIYRIPVTDEKYWKIKSSQTSYAYITENGLWDAPTSTTYSWDTITNGWFTNFRDKYFTVGSADDWINPTAISYTSILTNATVVRHKHGAIASYFQPFNHHLYERSMSTMMHSHVSTDNRLFQNLDDTFIDIETINELPTDYNIDVQTEKKIYRVPNLPANYKYYKIKAEYLTSVFVTEGGIYDKNYRTPLYDKVFDFSWDEINYQTSEDLWKLIKERAFMECSSSSGSGCVIEYTDPTATTPNATGIYVAWCNPAKYKLGNAWKKGMPITNGYTYYVLKDGKFIKLSESGSSRTFIDTPNELTAYTGDISKIENAGLTMGSIYRVDTSDEAPEILRYDINRNKGEYLYYSLSKDGITHGISSTLLYSWDDINKDLDGFIGDYLIPSSLGIAKLVDCGMGELKMVYYETSVKKIPSLEYYYNDGKPHSIIDNVKDSNAINNLSYLPDAPQGKYVWAETSYVAGIATLSTMPAPRKLLLGKKYKYTGSTTELFDNNKCYECKEAIVNEKTLYRLFDAGITDVKERYDFNDSFKLWTVFKNAIGVGVETRISFSKLSKVKSAAISTYFVPKSDGRIAWIDGIGFCNYTFRPKRINQGLYYYDTSNCKWVRLAGYDEIINDCLELPKSGSNDLNCTFYRKNTQVQPIKRYNGKSYRSEITVDGIHVWGIPGIMDETFTWDQVNANTTLRENIIINALEENSVGVLGIYKDDDNLYYIDSKNNPYLETYAKSKLFFYNHGYNNYIELSSIIDYDKPIWDIDTDNIPKESFHRIGIIDGFVKALRIKNDYRSNYSIQPDGLYVDNPLDYYREADWDDLMLSWDDDLNNYKNYFEDVPLNSTETKEVALLHINGVDKFAHYPSLTTINRKVYYYDEISGALKEIYRNPVLEPSLGNAHDKTKKYDTFNELVLKEGEEYRYSYTSSYSYICARFTGEERNTQWSYILDNGVEGKWENTYAYFDNVNVETDKATCNNNIFDCKGKTDLIDLASIVWKEDTTENVPKKSNIYWTICTVKNLETNISGVPTYGNLCIFRNDENAADKNKNIKAYFIPKDSNKIIYTRTREDNVETEWEELASGEGGVSKAIVDVRKLPRMYDENTIPNIIYRVPCMTQHERAWRYFRVKSTYRNTYIPELGGLYNTNTKTVTSWDEISEDFLNKYYIPVYNESARRDTGSSNSIFEPVGVVMDWTVVLYANSDTNNIKPGFSVCHRDSMDYWTTHEDSFISYSFISTGESLSGYRWYDMTENEPAGEYDECVFDMPAADATNVYKRYKYIGATGGGLTRGYIYISSPKPDNTYVWKYWAGTEYDDWEAYEDYLVEPSKDTTGYRLKWGGNTVIKFGTTFIAGHIYETRYFNIPDVRELKVLNSGIIDFYGTNDDSISIKEQIKNIVNKNVITNNNQYAINFRITNANGTIYPVDKRIGFLEERYQDGVGFILNSSADVTKWRFTKDKIYGVNNDGVYTEWDTLTFGDTSLAECDSWFEFVYMRTQMSTERCNTLIAAPICQLMYYYDEGSATYYPTISTMHNAIVDWPRAINSSTGLYEYYDVYKRDNVYCYEPSSKDFLSMGKQVINDNKEMTNATRSSIWEYIKTRYQVGDYVILTNVKFTDAECPTGNMAPALSDIKPCIVEVSYAKNNSNVQYYGYMIYKSRYYDNESSPDMSNWCGMFCCSINSNVISDWKPCGNYSEGLMYVTKSNNSPLFSRMRFADEQTIAVSTSVTPATGGTPADMKICMDKDITGSNNTRIMITHGDGSECGATLQLYGRHAFFTGNAGSNMSGQFQLIANNGLNGSYDFPRSDSRGILRGYPNGKLTWCNYNVVVGTSTHNGSRATSASSSRLFTVNVMGVLVGMYVGVDSCYVNGTAIENGTTYNITSGGTTYSLTNTVTTEVADGTNIFILTIDCPATLNIMIHTVYQHSLPSMTTVTATDYVGGTIYFGLTENPNNTSEIKVPEGCKVYVRVAPNSGYTLRSWSVTNASSSSGTSTTSGYFCKATTTANSVISAIFDVS